MATTVSQRITLEIKTTEVGSGDLGDTRKTHIFNHEGAAGANFKVFPTGTTDASLQQDLVYSDTIALAAGTAILDLTAVLTDIQGTAMSFDTITAITVKNLSSASGELLKVGAGSNPLLNWIIATGDGVQVGPLGAFHISSPLDGYAVTATTGDVLTFDSGAATFNIDVVIHGRSS